MGRRGRPKKIVSHLDVLVKRFVQIYGGFARLIHLRHKNAHFHENADEYNTYTNTRRPKLRDDGQVEYKENNRTFSNKARTLKQDFTKINKYIDNMRLVKEAARADNMKEFDAKVLKKLAELRTGFRFKSMNDILQTTTTETFESVARKVGKKRTNKCRNDETCPRRRRSKTPPPLDLPPSAVVDLPPPLPTTYNPPKPPKPSSPKPSSPSSSSSSSSPGLPGYPPPTVYYPPPPASSSSSSSPVLPGYPPPSLYNPPPASVPIPSPASVPRPQPVPTPLPTPRPQPVPTPRPQPVPPGPSMVPSQPIFSFEQPQPPNYNVVDDEEMKDETESERLREKIHSMEANALTLLQTLKEVNSRQRPPPKPSSSSSPRRSHHSRSSRSSSKSDMEKHVQTLLQVMKTTIPMGRGHRTSGGGDMLSVLSKNSSKRSRR